MREAETKLEKARVSNVEAGYHWIGAGAVNDEAC
jgi:hypothetical protein